jgi:hypothetical protein
MSDLALKITADTAAASMSFKDMASSSEVLQKKIAKLSEDLGKSEGEIFHSLRPLCLRYRILRKTTSARINKPRKAPVIGGILTRLRTSTTYKTIAVIPTKNVIRVSRGNLRHIQTKQAAPNTKLMPIVHGIQINIYSTPYHTLYTNWLKKSRKTEAHKCQILLLK